VSGRSVDPGQLNDCNNSVSTVTRMRNGITGNPSIVRTFSGDQQSTNQMGTISPLK